VYIKINCLIQDYLVHKTKLICKNKRKTIVLNILGRNVSLYLLITTLDN